jgi:hypothetical protein
MKQSKTQARIRNKEWLLFLIWTPLAWMILPLADLHAASGPDHWFDKKRESPKVQPEPPRPKPRPLFFELGVGYAITRYDGENPKAVLSEELGPDWSVSQIPISVDATLYFRLPHPSMRLGVNYGAIYDRISASTSDETLVSLGLNQVTTTIVQHQLGAIFRHSLGPSIVQGVQLTAQAGLVRSVSSITFPGEPSVTQWSKLGYGGGVGVGYSFLLNSKKALQLRYGFSYRRVESTPLTAHTLGIALDF